MGESVFKLLGSSGLSAKDINEIIFSFPDTRRSAELAMGLGFDPETQLQDTLMDSVDNTGCAQPLILLTDAIEDACQGDKLLLANYRSGSDAFIFKVQRLADQSKGAGWCVKA